MSRVIYEFNSSDSSPADERISPRHAELIAQEDGVCVRDLGSDHGTRVDGEIVDERVLAGGERVEIGPLVFYVSRAAAFLDGA